MAIYRKKITVGLNDLDELRHVNNVRYLEWVQQISKEHWESTVENKVLDDIIWVVRNHNITYLESAVLHDSIEITTNVIQWKGPISIRQVEMKNNKTGKVLVKASTQWCALDAKSLKPIRVPANIKALFTDENERMA